MRRTHFITISAGIIVTLCFGLLIHQRFTAEVHQNAYTEDATFKRGEIITTSEDFLRVRFGRSTIWLDENTEILLVNGEPGDERINVIQGRVYVNGELEIQTRELITYISEEASFVHYSWEDTIDVASINGEVFIETENGITLNQEAVQVKTLAPYESEEIIFDPTHPWRAEFYETVLEK